jgi:hypothetical protein
MKLVDKIEVKERVEKLTEERRDDFFVKMITGKDVTEEAETSKGVFTLKYPKAKDLLSIGRIAAFRRNFKSVDGFDAGTEMINVMASTLDVMAVSGPAWFGNAKKTNTNFSFPEAPGREFLAELYGKAHSFRENAERRLSQGEGISEYLPRGAMMTLRAAAYLGLSPTSRTIQSLDDRQAGLIYETAMNYPF